MLELFEARLALVFDDIAGDRILLKSCGFRTLMGRLPRLLCSYDIAKPKQERR